MRTTYTTTGSVRGDCGHQHRTPAAARACIDRDHRACASQGGYSDRLIVAVTGSEERPLTEDERDAAGGES